jgi:IS605 OrfB family transposase
MSTLTYCKGLPTPESEMNALGQTKLEMFLESYAPIFRSAAIETVNHLLYGNDFNKSQWNTHLQKTYGINKRHANSVISFARGRVDGAKTHRELHIKTIAGKIKSIEKWLKSSERKLKLARKFYAKKNWQHSKTGCNFPLSCSLKYREAVAHLKVSVDCKRAFPKGETNWSNLKFQIHSKKRKLSLFKNKLEHLKVKPIRVWVPHGNVFIVGSKDESCGNQVAQWDGQIIKIRVPECLEFRFGKTVTSNIGDFPRNINRLPESGSKTWHFFYKNGRWVAAVQFTPKPVKQQSQSISYGCIGIDMNPGSIGWAYVDSEGNLKAKGQIPLQMGLPLGKQDAQIIDACLQLAFLAISFECPVVCEELDFSNKKERLGEESRKYARMLSSWAYSRFYDRLQSILSNRGIELIAVNPAYSSLIGLVKYMRMYGLSSDCAAALVIARRGMRLDENPPFSITAYASVNEDKHVWSFWSQLNKKIKRSSQINRRHDYFTVSNWSFLVNLSNGEA